MNLPHFAAPREKPQAMMVASFTRWMRATILAIFVASLTGCAMFDMEKWDPNRLRDERAVDVDRRLSERAPIVENPF